MEQSIGQKGLRFQFCFPVHKAASEKGVYSKWKELVAFAEIMPSSVKKRCKNFQLRLLSL